ncbi:hypothetical protein C8R47DRAFT_393827 [Mycena vitilis]|nr:hypothetical protein C8R47DRAFT_393827 [Mycena vitilis]
MNLCWRLNHYAYKSLVPCTKASIHSFPWLVLFFFPLFLLPYFSFRFPSVSFHHARSLSSSGRCQEGAVKAKAPVVKAKPLPKPKPPVKAVKPVAKPPVKAVTPVAKPPAKPPVKAVKPAAAKPPVKAVKPKPPVKAVKPVAKPATKPAAKQVTAPVNKPAAKPPVAKPATKPAAKPPVKPVAKGTTAPAKAPPVAKAPTSCAVRKRPTKAVVKARASDDTLGLDPRAKSKRKPITACGVAIRADNVVALCEKRASTFLFLNGELDKKALTRRVLTSNSEAEDTDDSEDKESDDSKDGDFSPSPEPETRSQCGAYS